MSNAMRLGTRTLAGVAAGALALGVLSIAGASTASAKPNVKPKVTLSQTAATVAPVRYSVGTTVLYAPLMFKAKSSVVSDDSIVFSIGDAPTTAAGLYFSKTSAYIQVGDDSITYANADDTSVRATITGSQFVNALSDDSTLYTQVSVNASGTYNGTIQILDKTLSLSAAYAAPKQTVTFSLTTAGAPASLSLAPAAISLAPSPSDQEFYVLSVKDADGRLTQLGVNASGVPTQNIVVTKGANPTGGDDTTANFTPVPSSGTALSATAFDDAVVTTLGTYEGSVTGIATATPGTRNLVFTPSGVGMSAVGVTNIPVTVVASAASTPSSLKLTAPTTQVLDDTNTDDTKGYFVNSNLITTAQVTGAGATPSAPYTASITSTVSGTKLNGVALVGGPNVVTSDAAGVSLIGLSWTAGQTGRITIQTGSGTTAQPNRWVVINVVPAANAATTTPSGAIIVKTGDSKTFEVSVVDTFGNAYANYSVLATATSNSNPAVTASGTQVLTNALGKATVTAPPPSATFAGAATISFTVRNAGGTLVTGSTVGALTSVAATYSASGDVTSLSVGQAQSTPTAITNTTTSITKYPSINVPFGGATAALPTAGSYTAASGATPAADAPAGTVALFVPAASPANDVTVTVPAGLKVSKTAVNAWDGGAQTVTVATGANVFVFGTKVGTYDVTFKSGSITTTAKVKINTVANAAYNIALDPATKTIRAGSIDTINLKVTDVFGNPVKTTDDSGAVTVSVAGQALLAGNQTSIAKVTTDAEGKGTITLIAGQDAGAAAVTAVPNPTTDAPAWKSGYVAPTGAPKPVTSATAAITVEKSAAKTISITSSGRTTVSGKPGVYANGSTTGFTAGDTLKVFVKFPGQSSYAEGSAKPAIDSAGAFDWSRKTGKKTYVYFTNNDGLVKSNSVIIPAA